MFFYVYILISLRDKRFYIGLAKDLRRRLKEHRQRKVKSTRYRLPLKLICYEAYLTKREAQKRERYLKTSDGRKELRIRLAKTLEKSIGGVG